MHDDAGEKLRERDIFRLELGDAAVVRIEAGVVVDVDGGESSALLDVFVNPARHMRERIVGKGRAAATPG